MSKTNQVVDPNPIARFLHRLAERLDLTERFSSSGKVLPLCQIGKDKSITLSGKKEVIFQSIKEDLNLCIVLVPGPGCYIVQQFAIYATGYLNESELLAHYGKDYYYSGERDLSGFWTINCARDLEALVQAYDRLAKFYGKPTVFDLPL